MESYIVRIYRRDPKDAAKIVGQVEVVEDEVKRMFGNRKELWEILKTGKTVRRSACRNDRQR